MKRSRVRRVARRRSGLGLVEQRRLHELFRDVVMIRAGAALFTDRGRRQWRGPCEWCRKTAWLQAAHIEPKGRFPALRFEPENAVALCVGCHLFRWHRSPREAEEWIRHHLDSRYGAGTRDRLALRATTTSKPDYVALKIRLEAMLRAVTRAGFIPRGVQ